MLGNKIDEKKVKEFLNFYDNYYSQDRLINHIWEWVNLESCSYEKAKIDILVDKVAERGRELKLQTKVFKNFKYGNMLVLKNGDINKLDSDILILCHLDTVHKSGTLDLMKNKKEDGYLYGPGIYDMKGGACNALEAYSNLFSIDILPSLKITFLFTGDEEIGSFASRDLIKKYSHHTKYILVTEPRRPNNNAVVIGRKGSGFIKVDVKGKSAHAGMMFAKGNNAIVALSKVAVFINSINNKSDNGSFTLAVTKMEGGVNTSDNTIPDLASLYVDIRVSNLKDEEYLKSVFENNNIKELLGSYYQEGIEYDIKLKFNRPAWSVNKETNELFDFCNYLSSFRDENLIGEFTGGSGDANFAYTINGAKIIDGLGVGGSGAHTLDEKMCTKTLKSNNVLMAMLLCFLK